jgi:two-component system NarL family sensor kinase
MNRELRVQELVTLKTIAEHLNEAVSLDDMLNSVLEKLLALTGLATGWIFLVDDAPRYSLAAHSMVPPALNRNNKEPMRQGSCWCLDRYWDGRLESAVNILNCKRIENAVKYKWGETAGISHHATIPLRSGSQLYGLLNVASPGKIHFSDEELALLQSVAYQIGTAIERSRLFTLEQKRADAFAKLGGISRRIASVLERCRVPEEAIHLAGPAFDWPIVRFWTFQENAQMTLRAEHMAECHPESIVAVERDLLIQAAQEQRLIHAGNICVVPLPSTGSRTDILQIVLAEGLTFDRVDIEVIEVFAEHVWLALENACLHERHQQLVSWEDRNRLARDLHDSVNQTLFSLNLTARGLQVALPKEQLNSLASEALQDIQQLSQHALKEMRSLILQLRPEGMEDGLITALVRYAEQLGLRADVKVDTMLELPRLIEEALLRIGQEALNNASKYAGIDQVTLGLHVIKHNIVLMVKDEGTGFSNEIVNRQTLNNSIGLRSMSERAEELGGTCSIESEPGKGTIVRAVLPMGEGGVRLR